MPLAPRSWLPTAQTMALFLSYPQYPQNSQRKKEAKKESLLLLLFKHHSKKDSESYGNDGNILI